MSDNNFGPILGHERNIDFFKKLLTLDRQGQDVTTSSYILSGPVGIGKKTVLFWFLQNLLCSEPSPEWQPCGQCSGCQQLQYGSWPDMHIVKREEGKKNISIEQVRDLIQKLGLSSFLNSYKVGIIYEADRLSLSAANALLKQLEEPNAQVLIFLITSSLHDLPLTIVSRSQHLHFQPVAVDLIYDYLVKERHLKRSQAKNIAQLAAGRPNLAWQLLDQPDYYQAQLIIAKNFALSFASDINWRLQTVNDLHLDSGQAGSDQALSILDTWQNVIRDILIYTYGETDLVQHQALAEELQQTAVRQPVSRLLQASRLVTQAKDYVRANVNAKVALEQAIINI